QRTHDAEVRQPVQCCQALLRKVLLEENNGAPGSARPSPVFPVDRVDQLLDALFQSLIFRNPAAAGDADLHEHQALAVARILGEETVDGAQPLANSLSLIEAVDPDTDQLVLDAQRTAPALCFLRGFPRLGGRV